MNSLYLLLWTCLPAGDLTITGELKTAAYRAVRLSADPKPSDAALAIWFVTPDERLDVVEESASRLVFVAPPGKYLVRLVVKEPNQPQISARAEVSIEIPPAPPTPPSPPSPPAPIPPTPPPTPPAPPTATELAERWAAEVQSVNKKGEAESLATAFESVATRIDAGEWRPDGDFLLNRKAVKAALREANRLALGTSAGQWLVWFQRNQPYMDEFDKHAISLTEFARLWREQAAGLRRVK